MINQEEINAMLANEIRNLGLNDALKLDKVKERVMEKIKQMSGQVNEMENPAVAQSPTEFPEDEEQFQTPPVQQNFPTQNIGMEAGAQPLDVPTQPKTAIVPEIPDFLKDVEPGKIFVYDFNELSVGGENLSNKPFKTLDDPDITKSMQQMWSENGTTKVDVFQTKFEKIGEIVFDYRSGMSQFIERSAEPDFQAQQQYKENPYASDPQKEIEFYVKNNVDVDQKINDVITNIVKDYFLTNSERAQIPVQQIQPEQPIQNTQQNVPGTSNLPGNIYPISEGTISTVKEMVSKFKKVDSPKELIESIQGKSKSAILIGDNGQVKIYKLNEQKYFLPSDTMSIRKCYVE